MSDPYGGLKITLDDSQLQTVVAQTILDRITSGDRDKIVREAVVKLIQPVSTHGGYRGATPLETAFHGAVKDVAGRVVAEYIEAHPEIIKQIEAVVTDGLEHLLRKEGVFRSAIVKALDYILEEHYRER